MMRKLARLLIAVFLVVNLLAGISFVHSVAIQSDNVYRHERTETDNFTVLQEDNDQDDFKNYVVSSDGSTVYFKAHYAPNQNYAGSKGVRLFYLKKDTYKAQFVSEDTITEVDQFIFLDENSLLFDGAVIVENTPTQGLFKANFSAKSIQSIKEVDTLSSIITKTLFIGANSGGLLSIDKNFKLNENNEINGGKIYFPLTFSKDYEGEINVIYQKDDNTKAIGKLNETTLTIAYVKDLSESDTIEGTSLSFYFDGTNTIAVKEDGTYSILFAGKPIYKTTINGKKIIGNKKSLYVHLKEKLHKIDQLVESLFISESTGFYVKEGKVLSFTVSDDNVNNVGAIYNSEDASEILTFNSGNLIMKTCNKYSKICSVKRMDDKKVSTLIEDTDNDDKGNWDYLLLPLSDSGFEFSVLVHADSSNPFIVKFALKPPVTCFGISNKIADVCSGNGVCVADDKCECTGNFAGEKCDKCTPKFEGKYCSEPKIHKCYGVQANSSNVCGGKRGTCLSENNCECRVEYFGNECEHTYCFGVPSISTTKTVCGGKGACVDYNECKCEDKYSGSMCEYYENTLISTRGLYPIMITYGVVSLVTVMGLLMLVFCFLGRHRKEYLALYGNRSIISHHDPINGEEEDEELDETNFLEREQQTEQPKPTQTPQNKPQGQEYALDESDEDL